MQSLPFDMIELNRSFKTKEEAIRYCGQKLVEAGCVDEEYIDAMVERDNMLSVYMGNFIAIPHGTDEAKKYVKKSNLFQWTISLYPSKYRSFESRHFISDICGTSGNKHHLRRTRENRKYRDNI
ncbi:PTS sugar transporter subunit IIA [Listeria innocua]